MIRTIVCCSLFAFAAACSVDRDEESAPAAVNVTEVVDEQLPPVENVNDATGEAWSGRWTGVEGMYLAISPGAEAGTYRLEMQYDLDNRGVFEGREEDGAIVFERGGETLRLRRGDGDETGLRYLFGKQDCLIVASGEGYCRD